MIDLVKKVMYKIKSLPYSDSYFLLEINKKRQYILLQR